MPTGIRLDERVNRLDVAGAPTGFVPDREALNIVEAALRDFGFVSPDEKRFEYQQSPAERRVDFAAIKRVMDEDVTRVDLAMRVPIRKVLDDLIELIKRQDKAGGITDSFVMGITLTTGPEAQKILGDYLLGVWKRGRGLAVNELPNRLRQKIQEFAFCPTGEGGGIDNSCSPTGEPGEVEVLHGTAVIRTQKIIEEGLKAGKYHNWAKEFGPSDKVYVTTKRETALEFARVAGGKAFESGKWAIVRARVPRELLKPDPRLTDDAEAFTIDKVNPDWIKEVEIYEAGIHKTPSGTPIYGERLIKKLRGHGAAKMEEFVELWIPIRPDHKLLDNLEEEEISDEEKKKSSLRRFAGLEPVQAINFFQNLRPWLVKGIIDDDLKKIARLELTEHLKGGRTLTETIGNLRSAWEPWVGDPTKVIPSGISGTAADILQAYRLENIVRTEAITALSQGRAEIADEAGDFVIGYQLSPIIDPRNSEVCARIGEFEEQGRPVQYRKDDPRAEKLTPALHWQCRTIPVFITTDDLPVRWSTEAELDSVLRLVPEGFK